MKPATEALPGLVLATRSLAQRDMPYRLVGVLLVVGVPVLFWTPLVAIVSRALAIDIGPTGLISCALVVGVVSLVGGAAVISGRTADTAR